MKRIIPYLILALAALGLADSIYLTLVHFGVSGPEPQLVARFCQMKAGSCETVAQSSSATTIGIPNAIFGALYFVFLIGIAVVRIVTGTWLFPHLILGVMVLALAFSGYMVYWLLFRLDVPCVFCLTAHAINLAAFLLFVASWQRTQSRPAFKGRPNLGTAG